MRKITLQLESLAVESFDTTAVAALHGTVLAFDRTEACTNTCGDSCFNSACTCPGNNTCGQASCNGTCAGYTCDLSCQISCGTCGGPFSNCTSCC